MDTAASTSLSKDVKSQEGEQDPASSAAKSEMDDLPPELSLFKYQVAGHGLNKSKTLLGIMHHKDGYILKPMEVPGKENREVDFYETLQTAEDMESVQLRKFVPKYMGTTVLEINGKAVKFIILENITEHFAEPSIMDVKFGRITDDPFTSKKSVEDKKYISKQDLGFCIPGFQVYQIATGELRKKGKDYGKKLNKSGIVETLRLFLNADSGLSRQMMLQFLLPLWKILHWFRTQKKFCFYSSSILLAYDTRKLRKCLMSKAYSPIQPLNLPLSTTGNISFLSQSFEYVHRSCSLTSLGYSDQVNPYKGMITGRSLSLNSLETTAEAALTAHNSSSRIFDEDNRPTESGKVFETQPNVSSYDQDQKTMKESQLHDLKAVSNPENEDEWVKVKMIDFAHVYPSVDDQLDTNYLEGIENFVKILESIMHESTAS